MRPIKLLRSISLVALFSLLLPILTSAGDCPRSITTPTTLSEDLSCPAGGPRLDAADITLDCQGHTIKGAGIGTGVTLSGDRGIIRNCVIDGFETGARAAGISRATISDSVIIANIRGIDIARVPDARVMRNKIVSNKESGIRATQSRLTSLMNQFHGNGRDLIEDLPLPSTETPHPKASHLTGEATAILPQAPPPEPSDAPSAPEVIIFENTVTEDIVADLRLGPEARSESALTITIKRRYRIDGDRTVFLTALTARKDAKNLAVYEVIPKSITSSAFDVQTAFPHTITRYDPILRFPIGDLSKGQETRFEYSVPGKIATGATELPTSVIVTEAPISFTPPLWIEGLFSLFVIAFAAWIFEIIIGKATMNKKKEAMATGFWGHIILGTILAAVFLSLDLQTYIIVSNLFHQTIATASLAAGTIYFGVKAWLLWMTKR